MKNPLLIAASGSLAIKLGVILLRVAITVTFARILGVEGFGTYAFYVSLAQLMTLPAVVGGEQLTVRELAAYKATEKWGRLKGFLIRRRQACLAMSGLVILLASVAWGLGYVNPDTPGHSALFWITLAQIPFQAFLALQGATLRGLGHILLGQLAQNLLRSVIVIGLVIAMGWLLDSGGMDPAWALGAQLLSAIILLLVFHFILSDKLPLELQAAPPDFETSRWLKSALPFMLAGAMVILYQEVSILLLGLLASPEDVGLFRVAQRGAGLILFSQLAVNTTLGPNIARLHATGKIKQLQRIAARSATVVTLIGLGVGLVLALFGKPIIQLAFGEGYVQAHPILVLLCVGQILNLAMGSPDIILNMTHLEKYTAKGVAMAALLSLVLNLCLIPMFKATGAALATAASLVLWKALLVHWLNRETRIKSFILGDLIGRTP